MKMKLYYVVEDSGFDEDHADCVMLCGPFGTFEQAYANCKDYQFVAEQTIDVNL